MADEALGTAASGAAPAALFRGSLKWVVALTLIGAVLGGVAGSLRSDATTATATILVTPVSGNAFTPGGRGDDLLNLLTEAELVGSDEVAGAVAEAEGGGATITGVLKGLKAEVPPNTQLIKITYQATTKARAVDRAQLFAESFLAFRQNRAESAVNTQVTRIQEQVQTAERQLQELVRDVTAATGGQQALLRQRIDALTAYLVVLQTQLSESRVSSTYPGQVVTPSSADFQRSLTGPPLYAGMGGVLGVALGLLVAVFRARNTRHVTHAEDIAAIGPRLMATLPGSAVSMVNDAMHDHETQDLVLGAEFRNLRAAVIYEADGAPSRLMVASAGNPGQVPSAALGLALAFARTGLRTIVVDAAVGDAEGPSHLLGLTSRHGLAECLAQLKPWREVLVDVEHRLHVLPAGKVAPGLDDLLVSQAMSALLDELERDSDVLLVVTGSVHHTRSRELAALAGPVLAEVRQGEATFGEVAGLIDFEAGSSRGLLGVVFVEHKHRRSRG